jgi:hypothetical protein
MHCQCVQGTNTCTLVQNQNLLHLRAVTSQAGVTYRNQCMCETCDNHNELTVIHLTALHLPYTFLGWLAWMRHSHSMIYWA